MIEDAPLLTKAVEINQSEGIPGSGIPERSKTGVEGLNVIIFCPNIMLRSKAENCYENNTRIPYVNLLFIPQRIPRSE